MTKFQTPKASAPRPKLARPAISVPLAVSHSVARAGRVADHRRRPSHLVVPPHRKGCSCSTGCHRWDPGEVLAIPLPTRARLQVPSSVLSRPVCAASVSASPEPRWFRGNMIVFEFRRRVLHGGLMSSRHRCLCGRAAPMRATGTPCYELLLLPALYGCIGGSRAAGGLGVRWMCWGLWLFACFSYWCTGVSQVVTCQVDVSSMGPTPMMDD